MPKITEAEQTQKLFNRVISLTLEVDNLRTAYLDISKQLSDTLTLRDKNSAIAVKNSLDAQELARLALTAANVSYTAAIVLGDGNLIDATQKTVMAAISAHDAAKIYSAKTSKHQTEESKD